MNTVDKIKNSLWVIPSFIAYLNGLGFIYIGFKHNNRNWILEGVMYELPWCIYLIFFAKYGAVNDMAHPSRLIITFASILLLVSIIRSIWVAVKLCDVYDNEEKYTIKPIILNNKSNVNGNNGSNSNTGCCLCIIAIFVIFAVIAIF